MYNPKKFWSEAGKGYKAKSERMDELVNLENCIHKYLFPREQALEVGAGDGRVFLFLKNKLPEIKGRYEMCDFVASFRNACKRNTGIDITKWDGKILPYSDNEFHFVVSFSVLLHIPTSDIKEVFKEHVRVCEKYLFIATWFEEGDKWKSSGAYFRHDYFSLFKDNDLRLVETLKCSNPRRANWLLERTDA